ncbi:MAG: right-handed parallel beta-helix repeat-containing protein, partial [Terrimicrobiaceae bacterium]
MKSSLLRCLLGFSLFVSPDLPARDWFVNAATGKDDASGSKDAPLQTITKATSALSPGDRVVLAPGIYRETVVVTAAGTKDNPIVITSEDAANPAIISGADAITGWQPLAGSALPEAANPHAAEISYADVDFVPEYLFAGANKQHIAREPNTGWFSATTSDGKSLTSDQLGSVNAETLDGAQIFFFRAKGVEQELADVQGWSGAKGTGIELTAPLFKGRAVPYTEGDRFYLQNHIALLDQPGDWIFKKTETGARIFWWPPTKDALAQAEAPKRTQIVDLSDASHVTLRNIQVRHAAPDSNGFGVGFRNRHAAEGVRTGITLAGCAVYQNQRFGIAINRCRDATIKNCLVTDNSYGVAISHSRNVLVEENEIAWNLNDGLVVTWDTEDVVVKKNAIHHHSRFAHPDNFQTYRGVKNVLLDSNVLVASGQGVHTSTTVDLIARNNIFAGASANVFFTSGPDTKSTGTEKEGGGYVLENNTFALFANGAVIIKGPGHKMTGNIFAVQGGKYAYGSDEPSSGVTSKNNRFWISDSSHGILASFKEGRRIGFTNLEDLQKQTGLEEGSDLVDPAFPNA